MPTNLEYRARERQRKRESRRQASEAQPVKGRQGSRARDKKNKGNIYFLLEEQHENFVAVVTNPCHQCKVKMSGFEKVNENTYDVFFRNCVTEKFLEVSRRSCAKQRQRNVQKKCAARATLFFC